MASDEWELERRTLCFIASIYILVEIDATGVVREVATAVIIYEWNDERYVMLLGRVDKVVEPSKTLYENVRT